MGHINLKAFATRLLRGACVCAVLGDSVNVPVGVSWTSMMYGYERQLHPTAWAGVISSAATFGMDVEVTNLPAIFDTVGLGGGFGTVSVKDGDGNTVANESNLWPTYYGNGRFSTAAGNIANGATISRWNFTAARRSGFYGGDWGLGATTCRVVFYRGSVGVSSIGFYSLRNGGSFLNTNPQALLSGYNNIDIPIAAGAGDTLCEITGSSAGNNESGQNLYFMGMSHKANGVTGLTMGTLGIGGAAVADLKNTSYISDASITAFCAAFSVDTIMINIGTNDTQPWTVTQYNDLLSVIDRWRTTITNQGRSFKCLLISPYPQAISDYSTVRSYMELACTTNSDISYYDQNGQSGLTYAQILAAGYLAADNVHPSTTGANYWAALLNTTLERALSANPFLNPSMFDD